MTTANDERVLLLAPTSRDAALAEVILAEAGMRCDVCAKLSDLNRELAAGAGAVVLTDQVLADDSRLLLIDTLDKQPPWSDVPILLLYGAGNATPRATGSLERFVTVLERPVRVMSLVSALRSALKARGRQYQLRDRIRALREAESDLRALNATLEQRVNERTAEVEERAAQLSALAAELTQTEERERRRIAHLLHDGLQQILVAAQLHMGAVRQRADDQHNVANVESLLKQALNMARNLSVELSPPLLHDAGLVPALEWLCRRCLEQHGLRVDFLAGHVEELSNQAVNDFLFQAARELLFNVTKHARTAEAWLVVASPPGGGIRLEVRDAGVGCNVAAIAGPKGDHFGLFSIRERVQNLGGNLEIHSSPQQGTRVILFIPDGLHKNVSGDEDQNVQQNPDADDYLQAPSASGRVRVLLVDDHTVVRAGLMAVLRGNARIEVVGEAEDGVQAIEAAQRLRPDVVLMDISMPRMNGVEATRRLKAELPDIAVIGLSMHSQRDMASAMLAAGAVAYLCKTEPGEGLIAAILRAGVDGKREEAELAQ